MAGYSGTPLPAKLGVKPEQRLAVSGAPAGFLPSLGPLPAGARLTSRGPFDLGIFFVRSARALAAALARARPRLDPDGALWIGWPKKASGVPTDVTEDVVRRAALACGLVDVKVCAIDETWSGLRLVVPVRDRPGSARGAPPRRPARGPTPSRARG